MQPSIWSEFKKYLGDALPGGALNPELTTNINESPAPVGMAALRSFLGEAPDQLGVSVFHPQRAEIMRAANPAFAAGTALGVAPVLGGLSALKASRGSSLSAAPRNVEGALSRQAGVFVGPKSKTWNKAAAQRAVEMETAGIDPRDIWRETGTWRGPEGILRQEIDDSKARIRDYFYTPREALKESYFNLSDRPNKLARIEAMKPYAGMSKNQLRDEYRSTGRGIVDAMIGGDEAGAEALEASRSGLIDLMSMMRQRKYGPVSSYLAHGDLGQAYPDLYRMHTRVDPDIAPVSGQYLREQPGRSEQVVMQSIPTFSSDKSTMLHELQHPIQQREGFALGGNPGMFPTPLIGDAKTIADELAQGTDRMTINRWFKSTYGRSPNPAAWDLAEHPMIDRMIADDPVENYARLAGEAEARAVQARMKMSPEERRATYPADSYDRPIDQLILHTTEGPMYSLPDIKKYYRASTSGSIRPGMFLTPDENAARQFARQFDLPNVSEFSVRPRSSGDESDVERIAKALGIHEPGVPVDQYLMQGPDAAYAEAPQVLEELMNSGLDSLLLDDGMSKLKSLYVLDPSIVRKVGPVSGYARGGLAQLKECSCGR